MNELDLQSALHVLVHPNMGLTVRIVKRPGAELIDIALISNPNEKILWKFLFNGGTICTPVHTTEPC